MGDRPAAPGGPSLSWGDEATGWCPPALSTGGAGARAAGRVRACGHLGQSGSQPPLNGGLCSGWGRGALGLLPPRRRPAPPDDLGRTLGRRRPCPSRAPARGREGAPGAGRGLGPGGGGAGAGAGLRRGRGGAAAGLRRGRGGAGLRRGRGRGGAGRGCGGPGRGPAPREAGEGGAAGGGLGPAAAPAGCVLRSALRRGRPRPSPAMRPPGLCGAARLAAAAVLVLGAPLALAAEDCLWYLDRNGSWHPGFSCEFFTFCCGTCYQRYCCRDLTLLITERQQKHCLAFSPKTIAGIASAVILFVAVVATTICCFLCSCCYLYRRRQHLQSPFEGQEIPMTGIPVQPVYPYPQDPKAGPVPPQPGYVYPPSGPAPQYPLYPAGPPIYNPAAPPPYMPPQPSYPGA
uniref:Shisa family member 4 n=3 Tax=Canis lupus TaxID=9612 RepID=A0A8P0TLJ9_CANLF